MPKPERARRIATLWQLAWKGDTLRCVIYRTSGSSGRLELRLQSGAKTLLTEPFELAPKMISRTDALKRSLERRGWREQRR